MIEKTVKDYALEYYPKLWSKERLIALVKGIKLSAEDYKEITGENYSEGDA